MTSVSADLTFRGFTCAAWLCLLASCDLINPDEEIPAYIRIDSIALSTSYGSEGTASHRITDAWVFIDDRAMGAYELPARFPVLVKGAHTVSVSPGIKMNGIAATRITYPFYTTFSAGATLVAGETVTLAPVTGYAAFTDLEWMEDFEGAGMTLSATPKSDTGLSVTGTAEAFEGKKSGFVRLDPAQYLFEAKSTNAYALPQGGAAVFLEMNYRCNHPVVTGIFANDATSSVQVPVITLNPSPQWKKIYINLTQEVSGRPGVIDYNVFFGMLRDDSFGVDPEFYVDNIKLVH